MACYVCVLVYRVGVYVWLNMSIRVCTIFVCGMCMLSVHAYGCAHVTCARVYVCGCMCVQICTCVCAEECCMYMLRVCVTYDIWLHSPPPPHQFLFPMSYIYNIMDVKKKHFFFYIEGDRTWSLEGVSGETRKHQSCAVPLRHRGPTQSRPQSYIVPPCWPGDT